MHHTNSKAVALDNQELRAWVLSKPAQACSICNTSQGTLTIGSTKRARLIVRCQQHVHAYPPIRMIHGIAGGFSEDQVWFLNNLGRTTRYRLSKADEVVEGMPMLVRLEDNKCWRQILIGKVIDKDAPDHVLAQIYDCYRKAVCK